MLRSRVRVPPGETIFNFTLRLFSNFFQKKVLKLILKSFIRSSDKYQSNFDINSYDIGLFEHFDFSQNTVHCQGEKT